MRYVVFLLLLGLWPGMTLAAASSWAASASAVRVAGPGQDYVSGRMQAPNAVTAGQVVRVSWSYELPPGRDVNAWLCAGHQCLPLPAVHGRTDAFAGVRSDATWYFRFRLPTSGAKPVKVRGLEILVDCR